MGTSSPRTEFLIGAARPYLSIVCQSLVKLFVFCGKETRQTLLKGVLLVRFRSRGISQLFM